MENREQLELFIPLSGWQAISHRQASDSYSGITTLKDFIIYLPRITEIFMVNRHIKLFIVLVFV